MSSTATVRTRGAATAPARPRHQPAPAPVRRHLRPVPDTPARQAPSTRRRLRPQVALTMAIIAFFLILFGVALLQTVLVQGQLHLDGLRADLAERQTEAQLARLGVAEAGSPDNILDPGVGPGHDPARPDLHLAAGARGGHGRTHDHPPPLATPVLHRGSGARRPSRSAGAGARARPRARAPAPRGPAHAQRAPAPPGRPDRRRRRLRCRRLPGRQPPGAGPRPARRLRRGPAHPGHASCRRPGARSSTATAATSP